LRRLDTTTRDPVKRAENKGGEHREKTPMKLYDSIGPNPRVVRMFLAEKGITLPMQTVDLAGGENREPAHLLRNPHGQMPTLELDDGSYVSETVAICEYFEETQPVPALIGNTTVERAECRMWRQRIDLNICQHIANAYRFGKGLKRFESRIVCVPEAEAGLRHIIADRLRWLDGQLAGKAFLCGPRFTMADIVLFCWLDFGGMVGQPFDRGNGNVTAWFARVGERDSVKA
jgi:glutathione S-transferase